MPVDGTSVEWRYPFVIPGVNVCPARHPVTYLVQMSLSGSRAQRDRLAVMGAVIEALVFIADSTVVVGISVTANRAADLAVGFQYTKFKAGQLVCPHGNQVRIRENLNTYLFYIFAKPRFVKIAGTLVLHAVPSHVDQEAYSTCRPPECARPSANPWASNPFERLRIRG